MDHHDLVDVARQLPDAWKSDVLARIGTASLKLARMDALPQAPETHDYPEGLLVVDGQLELSMAGQPLTVRAGELCVVPAGVPHAVGPGSSGTLLIIDS